MKVIWQGFVLVVALALGSGRVSATAVSDEANPDLLSQCMTLKSTGQDRLLLARWIIAALGATPQVADVARVDPHQKDELDRQIAKTFTRLLTVDCLSEAKAAAANRSGTAFRTAGATLGQLAMRELLTNKDAEASLRSFAQYIDPSALKRLAP